MQQESLNTPKKKIDGRFTRESILKCWAWIAVAFILVLVGIIRIRLLHIPLERDEGEFAYMGQLMLQGIPPYLLAYNMKLPGIYAAYALVMAIFGQTIAGIHLGLMVVNAIAIVLLFLLTRRLFDDIAGVVAAICYGLLSVSPSALGTAAHATQFIVPLALGGTLLLLKSLDSGKYSTLFLSGLLYGLAFIMKQHAVFFIAFALLYSIWNMIWTQAPDLKKLAGGTGLLMFASAIPFVVSCATLYAVGVFSRFWFWTFTYASQYVSEVPLTEALESFRTYAPSAINPWGLLWAIAGIGLTAIFWNEKARSKGFFLIGSTLFSFLTICPGFFFRKHYFVTMLPAVALLAGVATSAMIQFLSVRKKFFPIWIFPILLIAAAIVTPTLKLSEFFFRATPAEASRIMYSVNPFNESIEIAEYIKNHSTKDDKIAVLGSEPQLFFYANRKSATGYIYVYGLMEPHGYAFQMQLDMIHEIEKVRPEYVVFVNILFSWLPRPDSDMTIFKWAQRYLSTNYRTVGRVEVIPQGTYQAYWDDDSRINRPPSEFNVYVLKRKEE